ncbi:hypothetical protein containing response regulat or receiver domain [Formosa agariphila KMM 3901]|uniref:Response regulatory domain-containing protein n=2 Tax=Formosa TaxID=225842 RepID=T2KJB9_FORAG|nr:hypothetical protein containing response regulat or receiver domain [Formosa agariphila KMM 3901]
MFSNPLESISAINKLKPDCVFLDIETPKEELLPFLNQLNFKGFDLVITTTYTHYASNIFNKNSLEHILKPIDSDEFIKVIGKIKKHKNDKNLGHTLQQTIIHLLQQK